MKKYLLSLFLILSISGCSYPAGKSDIKIEKLVASSSDIIDSTLVNTTKGQVIKYSYKTRKIVAPKQLNIKGKMISESIAERLPNAQFFHNGTSSAAILYAGDVETKSNGNWYEVDYATTTLTNFQNQPVSLLDRIRSLFVKNSYADVYSASGGDGSVWVQGSPSGWSNVVAQATGDAADGTTLRAESALTNSGTKYHLWRGFAPIDTSAIPDTATVLSASLTFSIASAPSIVSPDAYAYITVYGPTSQASTATLTTSDYNKYGTNAWSADYNLSGLNNSGTDTYTLNATGIAAVNKTGYTMLGIREGHDITGNAPGTNGGPDAVFYYTSSTGGSAPYLTVTYSTPGGAASPSQLIMVE